MSKKLKKAAAPKKEAPKKAPKAEKKVDIEILNRGKWQQAKGDMEVYKRMGGAWKEDGKLMNKLPA